MRITLIVPEMRNDLRFRTLKWAIASTSRIRNPDGGFQEGRDALRICRALAVRLVHTSARRSGPETSRRLVRIARGAVYAGAFLF